MNRLSLRINVAASLLMYSLGLLVPASSFAITVLGSGTSSCGTYLEARKTSSSSDALLFETYVAGFLTSVNVYTADTNNILESTDLNGAMYWLENYCRSHPTDSFVYALGKLVTFLTPTRKK